MTRLFNFLASPDIAVLLVLAGMLGLYIEMNQPGLLVPGIAGAVCLVLAAIAFQILPFDVGRPAADPGGPGALRGRGSS